MDALVAEAIGGDLTQSDHKLTKDQISALERIHLGSLLHTPLHIAAFRGHGSFVKEILKHCPDLALVLDERRWSPLCLAVLKKHMEIVKAILSKGPKMCGVIDDDGYNPLHLAAIMGWKEGLIELINEQPYVDFEVTSNGESILHLCVKHNNQDCLGWLLKTFTVIETFTHHEFINAKDNAGNNILHHQGGPRKLRVDQVLRTDQEPDRYVGRGMY